MAEYTYKGKRCLCYTKPSDFTDLQGIGKDPAYLRYDSVQSVINRLVDPAYRHFLAASDYRDMEDRIYWHVDEWKERPVRLVELTGAERERYEAVWDATVKAYMQAVDQAEGDDLAILMAVLKYRCSPDYVYCADDKVWLIAWGMKLDPNKHKVIGQVIHEMEIINKWTLNFDPGQHGKLVNAVDRMSKRDEGYLIKPADLPNVEADEGWKFDGWDPNPIGVKVMCDQTFVARYLKVAEPAQPIRTEEEEAEDGDSNDEMLTCRFEAGPHGTLQGNAVVNKWYNEPLSPEEIPHVEPQAGYRFKGWDVSPLSAAVTQDMVFTALYQRDPWYRRLWAWLTGKGCLKWLMWLLLLLLLLWLLTFLVDSCRGCSDRSVNGVVPSDTIENAKGKRVDDNGFARPVTKEDGKLPDESSVVAPVMGEGGKDLPIIEQPGMPSVIANRLLLFMEDSQGDLDGLARDFKKAYPGDRYAIIGYDKEVKMLVVRMPERERSKLRQELNEKLPNHRFFVFDEEVYNMNGQASSSTLEHGWHLRAIRLSQGWRITKGSSEVKVAVVDDGIDAAHPMFASRIVDAYNVFRKDNQLSLGEGHGTHTAALAVGCDQFYRQGASGVAPQCQLMPVQVFDNRQCPLSALVAGVMYAIHHDADVVNMSVGPSFEGLNQLPVEQQEQIAREQFQNQARLWGRICQLALAKHTVLVFAAGNDDILASIPPENRAEAAIVVSSVDERRCPTSFTNYGPCADISAPGVSIYSAFPRSSFSSQDGTSMSAPIVAGTVALMKSIKKDLTAEQARNVLYRTGADVYGYIPPMVQVDKALEAVQRGELGKPEVREIRPVPGSDSGEAAASGAADSGMERGDAPGSGSPQPDRDGTPGQGGAAGGSNAGSSPVSSSPDSPSDSSQKKEDKDTSKETDYDAIRRKIREYKQRIAELEKLLPQA